MRGADLHSGNHQLTALVDVSSLSVQYGDRSPLQAGLIDPMYFFSACIHLSVNLVYASKILCKPRVVLVC